MTSYNIYPTVPSAPEDPQVNYHLNVIQSKLQGLLKLKEKYKEKYEKYTKTLNLLVATNACSSGLSVTTGILACVTEQTHEIRIHTNVVGLFCDADYLNIECGHTEHIHRFSSEHSTGCDISGWGKC